MQWLREKALWVTGITSDRLLSEAKLLLVNALKTGDPIGVVIDRLFELFDPYIGSEVEPETVSIHRLENIVRTNSTEAYNQGRLSEFLDPKVVPFLKGVRYVAVLDTRTTEVCRYLDGRVFKPDSFYLQALVAPNHFNCRSIVSPVTASMTVVDSDWITDAQAEHAMTLADPKFLAQEEDYHTPGGHQHDQKKHGRREEEKELPWDEGKKTWEELPDVELSSEKVPTKDDPWPMSEVEVFSDYMDFGGADINRDLRDAKLRAAKFEPRYIPVMDGVFARAPELPRDVTAYRGITLFGTRKEAQRFEKLFGTSELKVGDTFTEHAFLSTSLNRRMAERFMNQGNITDARDGVILEFKMPKGTRAVKGRSDEQELIFRRGMKFKVTAIERGVQAKGYEYIDPPTIIKVEPEK